MNNEDCFFHDVEAETREEAIKDLIARFLDDKDDCPMTSIREIILMAMDWAWRHPKWVSVEDGLPPKAELGPCSMPVLTFSKEGFADVQRYHYGDQRWLYSQALWWMPFVHPGWQKRMEEYRERIKKGGKK